jgi:hypothetical protein
MPWSVLAAALATTACGSGGSHARGDEFQRPELKPVIVVENRNYQPMEVTLKVGGRRYVLGEVAPFSVARFVTPAGASGSAARMALQPPGEVLFYETPHARFAGSQELRLLIGPDVRRSTFAARK